MHYIFRRLLPLMLGIFLCLAVVSLNGESSNVSDRISQTELIARIQTQQPIVILDVGEVSD